MFTLLCCVWVTGANGIVCIDDWRSDCFFLGTPQYSRLKAAISGAFCCEEIHISQALSLGWLFGNHFDTTA